MGRKRNIVGLGQLLFICQPISHCPCFCEDSVHSGLLVGWAEMRVIFGNGRAGSVAVAVIYLREGSLRSTVVLAVLVEEQCWCCTWNLEQCWCCCSVVGGNGGDFPTLPPATPTSRARACTSIHNMRHTLHTGVFCLHTTTPCTILPLFLLCTFRNFTAKLALILSCALPLVIHIHHLQGVLGLCIIY